MKKAIACFLLLLGLDFASKAIAVDAIPPMGFADRVYPFGGIGILPDLFGVTFSLNYVVNTGAAWGFFAGYSGLLFIVRCAIIACMIGYLIASRRKSFLSKASAFCLGLVATGAVGNAVDYCLYGHVIDFLHFTFWGWSFPIFNLADSCITLGVLGLLLASKKAKQPISSL